jgi:hypothetical protein
MSDLSKTLADLYSGSYRFYGPNAFQLVFDRFDVGVGDRFYDRPEAYSESWERAMKVVGASLMVTSANKGALGRVRFVFERYDANADSWYRSVEYSVTQDEFKRMITLIPENA